MWQKRAVACQIQQFIHLELVCFSLEVFQAFNSLGTVKNQAQMLAGKNLTVLLRDLKQNRKTFYDKYDF